MKRKRRNKEGKEMKYKNPHFLSFVSSFLFFSLSSFVFSIFCIVLRQHLELKKRKTRIPNATLGLTDAKEERSQRKRRKKKTTKDTNYRRQTNRKRSSDLCCRNLCLLSFSFFYNLQTTLRDRGPRINNKNTCHDHSG